MWLAAVGVTSNAVLINVSVSAVFFLVKTLLGSGLPALLATHDGHLLSFALVAIIMMVSDAVVVAMLSNNTPGRGWGD